MSLEQPPRPRPASAMFCSTEMSPVERWGSGEGFVILRNVPGTDLVLPWGNTLLIPPQAHVGLPVRLEQLFKFSIVSFMF